MERFTKEYLIDILENQDYKGFIFLHPQIWQHKDLLIDEGKRIIGLSSPEFKRVGEQALVSSMNLEKHVK